MEPSELPKGLVLGRDRNIHIRLTGSTPLGDVGSNIVLLFYISFKKSFSHYLFLL